jgi:exosortase
MNTHSSPLSRDGLALRRAHFAWAAVLIVCVGLFWKNLAALVVYSLHNESCSHILLIPFVSAYLLFLRRRQILSTVGKPSAAGAVVILAGIVLYWLAVRNGGTWEGNAELSAITLAFVLICAGGFLASYGVSAARAAMFPLLFLLLMVPLPDGVLGWIIHVLQARSTDLTCLLFRLVGVPYLRQGFVIALPSVTIEVAAECSGIRSSIALFITCLLVAHIYLRTAWKIFIFLILVLPLTVIKNAIRIVTLTLLSIYVNPSFLHGRLHHDGGIVFFLLGLFLLLPVFLALERSERKSPALTVGNSAG